jgi:hypothetical protein
MTDYSFVSGVSLGLSLNLPHNLKLNYNRHFDRRGQNLIFYEPKAIQIDIELQIKPSSKLLLMRYPAQFPIPPM